MHKELKEFICLTAEYCLLPIALFIFTCFTEKKESENQQPAYLNVIEKSGYEFILIETFVFFSFFIRLQSYPSLIIFGINVIELSQVMCVVNMLVLLAVFVTGILNNKVIAPITTIVFRKTFYTSFILWLFSIFLTGIVPGFLFEITTHYYELTFTLILVIIVIVITQKFIKENILTYEVLFREFNGFNNAKNLPAAKSIGLKIFNNRYRNAVDDHSFQKFYQIAIELGAILYHTQDYNLGIKRLKKVKKHFNFPDQNNDTLYQILAGLYYKKEKYTEALNELANVSNKRQMYIDAINNREYENLFPGHR